MRLDLPRPPTSWQPHNGFFVEVHENCSWVVEGSKGEEHNVCMLKGYTASEDSIMLTLIADARKSFQPMHVRFGIGES
jgi:hypothetical protein